MDPRYLAMAFALFALLYSAPPLVTESNAVEICCSPSGDCPDGMGCVQDSLCDPEAPGYCVPLETTGR